MGEYKRKFGVHGMCCKIAHFVSVEPTSFAIIFDDI